MDERGVSADRKLLFDPYAVNRRTGSFIFVDRLSNATVGAGMILGALLSWDRTPQSSLVRRVSGIEAQERSIATASSPARC